MAAEETILSWNFANWLTVMLMVVLGFAIVGMATRIVKNRKKAAPTA